jgi:hypothetical protein
VEISTKEEKMPARVGLKRYGKGRRKIGSKKRRQKKRQKINRSK